MTTTTYTTREPIFMLNITRENIAALTAIYGWTLLNNLTSDTEGEPHELKRHVNAVADANDGKLDIPQNGKEIIEAARFKPLGLIEYSDNDVDYQLAVRAHSGTSWSPEDRGRLYVADYMHTMLSAEKEFAPWATDENRDTLKADLEMYRQKYLEKMNAYLHAHSSVISVLVAGPANFPNRRNQKRGATADKRRNEWLEWKRKTLKRLRQTYNPQLIANRQIKSSDDDAVAKLRQKLITLKAHQEEMKLFNKLVRKHIGKRGEKMTDATRAALIASLIENKLAKSEDDAAVKITEDYLGNYTIASWQLSNNNANIRRVEKRIKEVEALHSTESSEEEREDGLRIERDTAANRLRLFFPDKPSSETRRVLKANGFHWARSIGAWQAYLSADGVKLGRVLAAWDESQ